MALRVLTAEEKQTLQGYQPFIDNCYWSIRDYAAYWAIHDGAGLVGAALLKWAKDRIHAVQRVLDDGSVMDPNVPMQFAKLSKGMTIDLGAAPQPPGVINGALLAANKFEELASLYYDILGENINMSAGGN